MGSESRNGAKPMLKKLLDSMRKKDFDVIISQKLCCKSRKFNKLLIEKDITDELLLQIEVFLKMECPEFYMLVRLYEDHCIRKANIKKTIDDATTQEQ
jgi:hypothetical protein